jgi:hypothetical protein
VTLVYQHELPKCQRYRAGQASRGVRGGHERDGTDDPIRELRFNFTIASFRCRASLPSLSGRGGPN